MRRRGRTRPPAPLLEAYARRRGLIGTIEQQRGRTRLLEVAPRVGGVVNITRVTAGGAGGGGGGGGENIQETLQIGDDALGEDLFNLGKLSFVDGGELAIDGAGAITVTDSFHTVTTFATGTADDLVTINGGSDEQILMLRLASGAPPVTIKHGTGNILIVGDTDVVLDANWDWVFAVYDSELTAWLVLQGGGGGGGGGNTLDAAYDQGGAGAGRIVVVDSGAIELRHVSNLTMLATRDPGDAADRFALSRDGDMSWGSGAGAADVVLSRVAADHLALAVGDRFRVNYLADTAGTDRIRLQAASPHSYFTGNVQISQNLGVGLASVPPVDNSVTLKVSPVFNHAVAWGNVDIVQVRPIVTMAMGAAGGWYQAINGVFEVRITNAATAYVTGLLFSAIARGHTAHVNTAAALWGANVSYGVVRVVGTLNVIEAGGLVVISPTAFGGPFINVATAYGIWVKDPSNSSFNAITTVYSLKLDDILSGTNRYLIEAGPATPYFRVVGGAAPGANLSNVWLTVNNGAAVLRQIEIGAAGSGGAGFRILRVLN